MSEGILVERLTIMKGARPVKVTNVSFCYNPPGFGEDLR